LIADFKKRRYCAQIVKIGGPAIVAIVIIIKRANGNIVVVD
jgi:hypothetical protein